MPFSPLRVIAGAVAFAVAFIVLAIALVLRSLQRRRLAKSGIADIDSISGRTFEHYLEVLFSKLGYNVERTKFVGDYGGDLVVRRDGVRTVVQAKRYTKSVGVKAVQEAVAAKGYYGCTEAMVVTNSTYTKQALVLASKNKVVMWDRDRLVKGLERLHVKEALAKRELPPSVSVVEATVSHDTAPLADVVACAACTKILTAGERQYCERNKTRFGGKALCFRHQRSPRPAAPPR